MAFNEAIPKYAFGTAFDIGDGKGQIKAKKFKKMMIEAVKLGVRHFDCALMYKTHKLVGEVLREIVPSLVTREELFITSKIPLNMIRIHYLEKSVYKILDDLGLEYVDALLLHGPFFIEHIADDDYWPLHKDTQILRMDYDIGLLERTWAKILAFKEKGLCRFAGVCNINVDQLKRLNSVEKVDIVQNEYHMYCQDRELFEQCDEFGTHFEAYAGFGSPLRAAAEGFPTVFTDPEIDRISKFRKVSRVEIVMTWLHVQPMSFVIRTDNLEQLKENLEAMGKRRISDDDIIRLDAHNHFLRTYRYDQYKGMVKHPEYPFKGR